MIALYRPTDFVERLPCSLRNSRFKHPRATRHNNVRSPFFCYSAFARTTVNTRAKGETFRRSIEPTKKLRVTISVLVRLSFNRHTLFVSSVTFHGFWSGVAVPCSIILLTNNLYDLAFVYIFCFPHLLVCFNYFFFSLSLS